MTSATQDPLLDGVWRFTADHPDWVPEAAGDDGWEREVAWWAIATPEGLVLVDPLPTDWDALDRLVDTHGGCAAIVRTCHWHERSIPEASARYGAAVWARRPPDDLQDRPPFQHAITSGDELVAGLVAYDVECSDELALWLPAQAALLFGDAMLRRVSGELHHPPASWSMPPGGPERLREILRSLADLPVRHVLVCHGPPVLGDAGPALTAALA